MPQGRFLPGGIVVPPGIIGLGLASHQSPVVTADLVFLEERQVALEIRTSSARQVFGANHRSA